MDPVVQCQSRKTASSSVSSCKICINLARSTPPASEPYPSACCMLVLDYYIFSDAFFPFSAYFANVRILASRIMYANAFCCQLFHSPNTDLWTSTQPSPQMTFGGGYIPPLGTPDTKAVQCLSVPSTGRSSTGSSVRPPVGKPCTQGSAHCQQPLAGSSAGETLVPMHQRISLSPR